MRYDQLSGRNNYFERHNCMQPNATSARCCKERNLSIWHVLTLFVYSCTILFRSLVVVAIKSSATVDDFNSVNTTSQSSSRSISSDNNLFRAFHNHNKQSSTKTILERNKSSLSSSLFLSSSISTNTKTIMKPGMGVAGETITTPSSTPKEISRIKGKITTAPTLPPSTSLPPVMSSDRPSDISDKSTANLTTDPLITYFSDSPTTPNYRTQPQTKSITPSTLLITAPLTRSSVTQATKQVSRQTQSPTYPSTAYEKITLRTQRPFVTSSMISNFPTVVPSLDVGTVIDPVPFTTTEVSITPDSRLTMSPTTIAKPPPLTKLPTVITKEPLVRTKEESSITKIPTKITKEPTTKEPTTKEPTPRRTIQPTTQGTLQQSLGPSEESTQSPLDIQIPTNIQIPSSLPLMSSSSSGIYEWSPSPRLDYANNTQNISGCNDSMLLSVNVTPTNSPFTKVPTLHTRLINDGNGDEKSIISATGLPTLRATTVAIQTTVKETMHPTARENTSTTRRRKKISFSPVKNNSTESPTQIDALVTTFQSDPPSTAMTVSSNVTTKAMNIKGTNNPTVLDRSKDYIPQPVSLAIPISSVRVPQYPTISGLKHTDSPLTNVPSISITSALLKTSFPTSILSTDINNVSSSLPTALDSTPPSTLLTTNPSKLDTTFRLSKTPLNPPTSSPSDSLPRTPSNPLTDVPNGLLTHSPSDSPTYYPSDQLIQSPVGQPSHSTFYEPYQSTSYGPSQSTSYGPSQSTSYRPSQSSSYGPSQRSSYGPSQSSSYGPSQSSSYGPSQTSSYGPSQTSSYGPSHSSLNGPSHSSSNGPSHSSSNGPSQSSSYGSSLTSSNGPSQSSSYQPTVSPSHQLRRSPSYRPTRRASYHSTMMPSYQPTSSTSNLTQSRMDQLTQSPFDQPTQSPLDQPTQSPLDQPTQSPLDQPTQSPLDQPTQSPLDQPTQSPLDQPTQSPLDQPTQSPLDQPTQSPLDQPTQSPLYQSTRRYHPPSNQLKKTPSIQPNNNPSNDLNRTPSHRPNITPSHQTSNTPSHQPSNTPSHQPSNNPSHQPSNTPSKQPNTMPTYRSNKIPSNRPNNTPLHQPNTPLHQPNKTPSHRPIHTPSNRPINTPSNRPNNAPLYRPDNIPMYRPNNIPSNGSDYIPTKQPNDMPSSRHNHTLLDQNTGIPSLTSVTPVLSRNSKLPTTTTLTPSQLNELPQLTMYQTGKPQVFPTTSTPHTVLSPATTTIKHSGVSRPSSTIVSPSPTNPSSESSRTENFDSPSIKSTTNVPLQNSHTTSTTLRPTKLNHHQQQPASAPTSNPSQMKKGPDNIFDRYPQPVFTSFTSSPRSKVPMYTQPTVVLPPIKQWNDGLTPTTTAMPSLKVTVVPRTPTSRNQTVSSPIYDNIFDREKTISLIPQLNPSTTSSSLRPGAETPTLVASNDIQITTRRREEPTQSPLLMPNSQTNKPSNNKNLMDRSPAISEMTSPTMIVTTTSSRQPSETVSFTHSNILSSVAVPTPQQNQHEEITPSPAGRHNQENEPNEKNNLFNRNQPSVDVMQPIKINSTPTLIPRTVMEPKTSTFDPFESATTTPTATPTLVPTVDASCTSHRICQLFRVEGDNNGNCCPTMNGDYMFCCNPPKAQVHQHYTVTQSPTSSPTSTVASYELSSTLSDNPTHTPTNSIMFDIPSILATSSPTSSASALLIVRPRTGAKIPYYDKLFWITSVISVASTIAFGWLVQ